jgi:hypothetical protein
MQKHQRSFNFIVDCVSAEHEGKSELASKEMEKFQTIQTLVQQTAGKN